MLTDYAFPDADGMLGGADGRIKSGREPDSARLQISSREQRQSLCVLAPGEKRLHVQGPALRFLRHSLAHLLHQEKVTEIVLTGQVTEQCVLYTALDAHVRDYPVVLLTDAVRSIRRWATLPKG